MSTKRRFLDEVDWDPTHPYHYHTSKGEKIAVSEEDWNKYKDDPVFKEVKAAIEAERAAYPNPEYEIDKKQLKDFVDSYKQQSVYHGIINYKNFGESLPEGYSFTEEGLIKDKDGNFYGQSRYKDNPRFSLDRTKPFQYKFMPNKPVEQTVTFYPANIEKSIKQPQAVTRYLNVGKKKEEAINKNIKQNTKKYTPPAIYFTREYDNALGERKYLSDFGHIFIGNDGKLQTNNGNLAQGYNINVGRYNQINDSIDAKEYNKRLKQLNDFISSEDWFDNLYWSVPDYVTDTIPNKQKALKNAVIEVEEPTTKVIKKLGGSCRRYLKDGGIYIKPSHRGRFTALKERTGHSTTWFKENGTPAQKKMATFALNAAKWKH